MVGLSHENRKNPTKDNPSIDNIKKVAVKGQLRLFNP